MTLSIGEIEKLVQEDKTTAEIAKIVGTSRQTVETFMKKHGILSAGARRKLYINSLDSAAIAVEYKNGQTIKQLAIKYDVSTTVIKRFLIENEIHVKTNAEAHTKYSYDTKYFDIINTLDKAYLLGFLAADGFITDRHEIGLTLAEKDRAVIDFMQNQLKTNRPIRYIETTKAYELRLQNMDLWKAIQKYGLIPNKSLVLNIQEVVEKAELKDKFLSAFLLGYFDGDGGIYKTQPQEGGTIQFSCSVTGTLETCMFFKQYFQDIGFLVKRHDDTKNNYTWQIGGRNQVKKALSPLYAIKDELTFYLIRKYALFEQL